MTLKDKLRVEDLLNISIRTTETEELKSRSTSPIRDLDLVVAGKGDEGGSRNVSHCNLERTDLYGFHYVYLKFYDPRS